MATIVRYYVFPIPLFTILRKTAYKPMIDFSGYSMICSEKNRPGSIGPQRVTCRTRLAAGQEVFNVWTRLSEIGSGLGKGIQNFKKSVSKIDDDTTEKLETDKK